ncbi:MAG: CPBP family glutamic-type intramembrane protease, partial [Candidatus Atribacteria bacterium]|nr:CPBP family glutamic-type intramembrane protease [Candidatus Atribacteria bacterium]
YDSFLIFRFWTDQLPPEYNLIFFLISGSVWLLAFPLLVNALTVRRPIRQFGLTIGKVQFWSRWLVILLGVGATWAFVMSRFPLYRLYYPMFSPARTSLNQFLFYQGCGALYMFSWEFFCRGFLLFGLEEKYGRFAILIQLIAFTLLHRGKPEYLISILGGLGMGIFAYEAESFLPVFFLHFGTALLLDLFCLF